MKHLPALLLAASVLPFGASAADSLPAQAAPMASEQRIDALIRQNQLLAEENQSLRNECGRPKSKEESFAACMQAAKGQTSAMAAESIGSHCNALLKP